MIFSSPANAPPTMNRICRVSTSGGELADATGAPTRRLHVYGERWNLAADGYETVW
jgi:hypothetical protein